MCVESLFDSGRLDGPDGAEHLRGRAIVAYAMVVVFSGTTATKQRASDGVRVMCCGEKHNGVKVSTKVIGRPRDAKPPRISSIAPATLPAPSSGYHSKFVDVSVSSLQVALRDDIEKSSGSSQSVLRDLVCEGESVREITLSIELT
jgi:hypothetical protein